MAEIGGEISIKRSDITPVEPTATAKPVADRRPRSENPLSQISSGPRREKPGKRSGLDDNVGNIIDEAA